MYDYRITKYCPELDNVRKKKEHIKNKTKEEHPRAQDMHTYISNNSGSLKKEFMKIYSAIIQHLLQEHTVQKLAQAPDFKEFIACMNQA